MMSGCRRQCDWDKNMVCRSCGIDYGLADENVKKEVVIPPTEEE